MQKIRALDAELGRLAWEQETADADVGARQVECEQQRQALLLSPALAEALDAGPASQRLRRQRQLAEAIPAALVESYALATQRALGLWGVARVENDFSLLAPALAEVVRLARARGDALASVFGIASPYDALLDENDPGQREKTVRDLLNTMTAVPLRDAETVPTFVAAHAEQDRLCEALLQHIGFDFSRGQRGQAAHPFTVACGDNDVRLAIRTDEGRLQTALLTTLHEGGHALFDQRLLAAHPGSALGECPSAALHEAHARLFENALGRRAEFWHGARDLLLAVLPTFDLEAWIKMLRAPATGPLRLAADAVSYHRHIALRCELEAALISGALPVADLPGAWNEASQRWLGVTPAHDNQGCLQDNHWPSGMFGYFASYSTGEAIAFQLAETMRANAALARGDFRLINAWLQEHVPSDRETAEEVVIAATGRPLSAAAFLRAQEIR